MGIFKKNNTPQQKGLQREVGVAGDVVFEGFDKEESRLGEISIKQFREMLDKDPTVESLFNIFTLPIVAATYRIDADKDDTGETQADLIRKNLLEPSHKGGMQLPFSLFLDQLLLAIVDGFQLWEKVYKIDGGYLVLKKLAHRDSIGITLIRDDEGGYGGARQQVSYGSDVIDVTLPAHKTFLFTHNKARSFLYGRSSLTSLRAPYLKKRKLEWLDSIGLQADAIKPKLLRRVADSVLEKDDENIVGKTLSALARLGERKAVASIPKGFEVDVLDSNGRDPHQSIERQNSEMARAFLATFTLLGSQGGSNVGSYALSDNLSDMLMISLKAFMTKIEEHINQYIIADMHDLNFAQPHYAEFHFDDLTSDTVEVITEAFKKLLEKDRISDEMVEGIEEATANRLEIDLEQIKKDRKKRAEKEAKETAKKTAKDSEDDDDLNKPGGGKELSDINSRDFPELYKSMGVNEDDLGCIMLDLRPFDVVKHVPDGAADLVQATDDKDHIMGAVAEVQPHVTLLFGLLQNGNLMKDKVDQVLEGWKCDSIVLDHIDSFPVPADAPSVPIVAKLWSSDLEDANKRLGLLPHVNTFGNYNPHVTLAYVKNDPDTVQKWVKALQPVIGGMRINATGINYGDLPDDDEEDDAGSGGKFLSDDGNKWHRPLTEAEKTVRFAEIEKRMDTFEEKFQKLMEPITAKLVDNIIADVKNADPTTFDVVLPAEYSDAIINTIKEAYNYAKTGAADELKVSAPATSKEALQGMKDYTAFIVQKQQDDLKNLVRGELIKLRRQNIELADENKDDEKELTPLQQFQQALAAALGVWFAAKLQATAGAIVSQGVNNGRNDVFEEVANDDDLFQFSGLLDTKICKICRDLDNKVVTREEYRRSRWNPPIHFHCRCLWILIRKVSETFKLPDVTGMPDTAGGKTEPLL